VEAQKIKIVQPLPLSKDDCGLSVGDIVTVVDAIKGRPCKYIVVDPKTHKKLTIWDFEAEKINS
jgi:hypothetical protein